VTAAVDVVVVAYRNHDTIDGCLATARAVAAGTGGQVVVIDHGDGRDAARGVAVGATTATDATNPGFGAGQNRGVALTRSDTVLLLNPDAEVDPRAVAAGAQLLHARPDVAAVQGAVVSSPTGGPERSQGRELGPVHLMGRALGLRVLLSCAGVRAVARRLPAVADHVDRRPATVTEVDSLAATALLLRRAAFSAVGGFDESYFLYGEDLDLARRLRAAGWRLLAVPDTWAVHRGGASAAGAWEREVQWWAGTMAFCARWWAPGAWTAALAAALVRWARLAAARPPRAALAWRLMVVAPWRRRGRGPSVCRPEPGSQRW
jgi:N-acetylglucosaminyl-diphospho-decaprenol L-rhamnosyltransferase